VNSKVNINRIIVTLVYAYLYDQFNNRIEYTCARLFQSIPYDNNEMMHRIDEY
jgi:hypothetical protein